MIRAVLMSVALSAACASAADEPVAKTLPGSKRGYRIHAPPDLKPGERRAVVLWLHPSGGYMNEKVSADYWPLLKQSRVFLVLPDTTTPAGWTEADVGLMRDVLADVRENFAADTSRTILLGYSAGGQFAFSLWDRPNFGLGRDVRVAGVATFAAYPVKGPRDLALRPPPDTAKDQTAILFLCGDKDGGLRVCRSAQEILAGKGFSVRLLTMAGVGHAYSSDRAKDVAAWMAEVADGRRPAGDELYLSPGERKAAELALTNAAKAAARPATDPAAPKAKKVEPVPVEDWADPARRLSLQYPQSWKKIDAPAGAAAAWQSSDDPERQIVLTIREASDAEGWDHLLAARKAEFAASGNRYELIGAEDIDKPRLKGKLTAEHARFLKLRPGGQGFLDAPAHVWTLWTATDPAKGKWLRISAAFPSGGKPEDVAAASATIINVLRTVRWPTTEK